MLKFPKSRSFSLTLHNFLILIVNINIYKTHKNKSLKQVKRHAIETNVNKRNQFLELPSVSSNSYPSNMILIEHYGMNFKQKKSKKANEENK